MLSDKNKSEWAGKIKSIFTEAQRKFEEDAAASDLDLGADVKEDPTVAGNADGNVDGNAGIGGGEEEPEPTITVTASLLKALLDYCSAPDEEELPVDGNAVGNEIESVDAKPSMTAPTMTSSTGVMEDATMPVAGNAEGNVDGNALGNADGNVDGNANGNVDEDVSVDEIVQRLVDLSAESEGQPLDVDVLSTVFSPEEEVAGNDLGNGDLEGNVELPATTGDQALGNTVA